MVDIKLSEEMRDFLDTHNPEDIPIYEYADRVALLEQQSLELYDAGVKTEEARQALEPEIAQLKNAVNKHE
jgi:hypothetical protein